MNILVTGAAGFIGSHVAEALLDEDHKVIGVDIMSDYYPISLKQENINLLKKKGLLFLKADLADSTWQNEAGFDVDFIFHFAAQPGISAEVFFETYLHNNIVATQSLIQFASQCKDLKMFVNISTSSVYGENASENEEAVAAPISNYGVTKLAAEQLVLSCARTGHFPACSLRLFSVFGPRERPDKLYSKLISSILQKKPFYLHEGSGAHLRSFTFVDDIVRGTLLAIKNARACNGEIINLGTEEQNSTMQGVEAVESILGAKAKIKNVSARAGDQHTTKANITKAKKLLGYLPKVSLLEGLEKQVAYLKMRQ